MRKQAHPLKAIQPLLSSGIDFDRAAALVKLITQSDQFVLTHADESELTYSCDLCFFGPTIENRLNKSSWLRIRHDVGLNRVASWYRFGPNEVIILAIHYLPKMGRAVTVHLINGEPQ